MKGTVLHFSIRDNTGFIAGDDGNRYEFTGDCWGLAESPEQGLKVDFGIEDNRAIKIFADPNAVSGDPKSRTTAAGLAFIFGGIGGQFFYLGAWGWGILSVIFCLTYIPALVGLVFSIRWFAMSDKDFQRKIKHMKGAFAEIHF
jgi:TM2 domain-containing membrane protein YozV